jgi:hypothetical protein
MDSSDKVQPTAPGMQPDSDEGIGQIGQSGQTGAGQAVTPVSNLRITKLAGDSIGLGEQPQQPISDTAKKVSSQVKKNTYNSNSQEVDKLAKVALNSGKLTEVTDAETKSISVKNVDVKNMTESESDEILKELIRAKSNIETKMNFEGIGKISKEEYYMIHKSRALIKRDKQTGICVAEDINTKNLTENRSNIVGFCDLDDYICYFEDSDEGRAAAEALQEGNLIGNFEDSEDNTIFINNYQSMKVRFVDAEKWDQFVQLSCLIHTANLIEKEKNNIKNKLSKSDLILTNVKVKSTKEFYRKNNINKFIVNLIDCNYKINAWKNIIYELQEIFNKERNVDEKEEKYIEKQRSILNNYIKKEIIEKERRMMKRDKMNWFTLNMRSFLLYLIKKDVRILFMRGKD